MAEAKFYGQLINEDLIESDLVRRLQRFRENFSRDSIKFLFYSKEELKGYIGLCDVKIGRVYHDHYAISLRELGDVQHIRAQLYFALKELVRRERKLGTLDFKLGEFELDRNKYQSFTGALSDFIKK